MPPSNVDTISDDLGLELVGIDRLETELPKRPSFAKRVWTATWPKVAAALIAIGLWQLVVWSGWKPEYLLPGPFTVFHAMATDRDVLVQGSITTLKRALIGYLIALLIGSLIAIIITRVDVLRRAVSPLITGFQTMPSVAWVPLAITSFWPTALGHHLRHSRGFGASPSNRNHGRHRRDTTDTAPGRRDTRCQRDKPLPLHCAPGSTPRLRNRYEARMGLRLEVRDGCRIDRSDCRSPRSRQLAGQLPGPESDSRHARRNGHNSHNRLGARLTCIWPTRTCRPDAARAHL